MRPGRREGLFPGPGILALYVEVGSGRVVRAGHCESLTGFGRGKIHEDALEDKIGSVRY